jgi:diguanylate cyclase (GGDEF)-like protein/PAS domain S-box-containing protein
MGWGMTMDTSPTPDFLAQGWAVLDTLDSQVAVLNEAGEIVAVKASWQDFAARNSGEQSATGVGVNYLSAFDSAEPDEHARAAKEGLIGVLEGSLPEYLTEYPCHSPGVERWFRMRVRPLRMSGFEGAVVAHENITSKHLSEVGLLREHQRFTSLIRHADALIAVLDPTGTITYKSPAFESIVGAYGQESSYIDVFSVLHDDDVEVFRRALSDAEALESGTIQREFRMRRGDGSWRWIEATFTNLLEDPDVGGMVMNSRDITDCKHAQTVLAQQAESFATLFHSSAEALGLHDGTAFVAINRAYATMLRLTPEEVVGRPLLDFVAPQAYEHAAAAIQSRPEIPYDLLARRGDGSTFMVELLGRQIQYEGRSLRLLTARDVTQLRAEEEALRASEARQALLLQLTKSLRETRDPKEMLSLASELLGLHLETHRVWFFEVVDDATIVATAGWTDGTLPPLNTILPIAEDEFRYASELRAGNPMIVNDTQHDPVLAGAPEMGVSARSGIAIPLQRGRKWSGGLFVGDANVREWTEDEVALARDVAEQTWDAVVRGKAEAALRASEARFRALVRESGDILVVFNDDGGLRYATPALERILGHPDDTYRGRLRLDLVHPDERGDVENAWDTVRESPESQRRVAYRAMGADGEWVWIDAVFTNLMHLPEVDGIVLHARDATAQKRLEEELRHHALHDPLTGLPNRTLLADRMDQALRQAGQDGTRVGLLFLDLNGFKQINDAFGHEAGDDLLHQVAKRLQSVAHGVETVARLGGDEFVLLIPGTEVRYVLRFAERVQAAMTEPFACGGRPVPIGVTIGIAVSEPGLLKPDVLLRNGDTAMYRAKRSGRGHYLVHTSGLESNTIRRWRLRTDVAEAVDRGELEMYYQPVVALESGAISRMEALLRWRHPVYGPVPPDDFIPLAEEAGQIVALGYWGIRQVCEQLSRWGPDSPSVSLNFSATQFSDPGLVGELADQIAQSAIDPRKLSVEITEQVMIEDLAGAVLTLTQMRELGVGIALDDFGSGYSSLRYLRELPVTDVKLDRSFMYGLETDPGTLAVVSGFVTIAHAIGLSVTAEGVETAGQLSLMKEIGCDFGQGFYLGRPGPAPADPASRIDITTSPPWESTGSGLPA